MDEEKKIDETTAPPDAPDTSTGTLTDGATEPNPSFDAPPEAPQESLIPERETAESSFAERPGGNWTHPIEPQQPAPYTIPPRNTNTYHAPAKPSFTDTVGGKFAALMLCLCLIISGIAGFAGVLIGRNLPAAGGTPQTAVLWETPTDFVVPSPTDTGTQLTAAIDAVYASVVEISTETVVSGAFLGQSVQSGAGSGVVVTSDGYIVTNNHVIDGAKTITVRLSDGTSYPATLRGTDAETDLAVIKIEVAQPLTNVAVWTTHEPRIGQEVFAIGNPLGTLGGSVTDGILSALDREISVDGVPMRLLQTNAAVNPGNSGGGLFDLSGALIGIVNAKYTDESLEGLGFAIPSKIAKDIVAQLISQGYVSGRPQLGIVYLNVTQSNLLSVYNNYPDIVPLIQAVGRYGYYVENATNANVISGELLRGDYLISVDGKQLTSTTAFGAILRAHAVGDEVEVEVLRGSSQTPVKVVVKLSQKTITT